MRLSKQQIKSLQVLLHEQLGLTYADEEAQAAGIAIMRFVLANERRKATNKNGARQRGNNKKAA